MEEITAETIVKAALKTINKDKRMKYWIALDEEEIKIFASFIESYAISYKSFLTEKQ